MTARVRREYGNTIVTAAAPCGAIQGDREVAQPGAHGVARVVGSPHSLELDGGSGDAPPRAALCTAVAPPR
jgi:hypothetical protein